jgi:Zn-dependent protease with chaperone function
MFAVLLLPAAFSIWFRYLTAKSRDKDQATKWIECRRVLHVIVLLTVPVWWSVFSDPSAQPSLLRYFPVWVVLLIPPVGAIFVAQRLAYWSDIRFLDRRWTPLNVFLLATWSTVSFTIPLLMVAIGVQSIYDHNFIGILAIFLAGIVALIGAALLRSAEGFKPRAVKSGELYKRSLVLSKRMDIHLRRVCVVPFGRGRLTNAYASWDEVSLTDDYGHWLHGAELDFVISHELAHVKHRHALKRLLAILGVFALATVSAVVQPHAIGAWRVFSNFAMILMPLAGLSLVSRRFEYEADRAAVELTGEAEAGIRALTNLYRRTAVPIRRSRFGQLFSTHPSFSQRIEAIARAGQIPAERVSKLKEDFSQSAACNNS